MATTTKKPTAKRLPTVEEFERRTLYGRVGVKPGASAKRIASAYRKRAARYHPDRAGHTPAANKRFSLFTDAKNELLDPAKRAAYDASLNPAQQAAATPEQVDSLRDLLERLRRRDAARHTSFEEVLQRSKTEMNVKLWTDFLGRTPEHARYGDRATVGVDFLTTLLGSILLR